MWTTFKIARPKPRKREKKAKQKAEREKKEKAEADKKTGGKNLSEHVAEQLSVMASQMQRFQAFTKGQGKGGKQGYTPNPNQGKYWTKEKCNICGGKHLAQLRGKAYCPNTFAEANGNAEANKRNTLGR